MASASMLVVGVAACIPGNSAKEQTTATEIAGFTDFGAIAPAEPDLAPTFSAEQCYFASYPSGSKQCVTAPCTVTNGATAVTTCSTIGYVNFEVGSGIYGAYPPDGPSAGEIVALYPNPSVTFPSCVGGATVTGGEPSDPGDYYATGLVVGETSSQELANFCAGAIEAFPSDTPAAVTMTPTVASFGAFVEGQSAPPITFGVGNLGTQTTGPLSIAITGPNASDFVISDNSCTGTLGDGPGCSLIVTFTPSTASSETAMLTVAGAPGGTVQATLSGSGGLAGPPQFSSAQCYFTSYPSGSKQCVTAPCTVTNVATAITTCSTIGYVNFEVGSGIYGAYPPNGSSAGEIVALYPNPSVTFPTCVGGATVTGGEPSDPGDYYATGLVVGETSSEELANFCVGTIATFP